MVVPIFSALSRKISPPSLITRDFCYNCQTQSGSTFIISGSSSIRFGKTIKYCLLFIKWYTDTCILHRKFKLIPNGNQRYCDFAFRFIVVDSIFEQVCRTSIRLSFSIMVVIFGVTWVTRSTSWTLA